MSNILNIWDANTQQYVGIPAIKGASGVHYGTSEPTDPSHPVWIDPSGEGETALNIETIVQAVIDALPDASEVNY